MSPTKPPILRIEDVRLTFRTREGAVRALNGASLAINEGEAGGPRWRIGLGEIDARACCPRPQPGTSLADRSRTHPHRRPRCDAALTSRMGGRAGPSCGDGLPGSLEFPEPDHAHRAPDRRERRTAHAGAAAHRAGPRAPRARQAGIIPRARLPA